MIIPIKIMNKTIIKHNNVNVFFKNIKKFRDQYKSARTNIKKC